MNVKEGSETGMEYYWENDNVGWKGNSNENMECKKWNLMRKKLQELNENKLTLNR